MSTYDSKRQRETKIVGLVLGTLIALLLCAVVIELNTGNYPTTYFKVSTP